jgi:peptide/nickel transport system permease protein
MKILLYVVKRMLLLIPLVLGVTVITFVLTRVLIAGNPVDRLVQPMASEETRKQVAQAHGLNDPLPVQYLRYIQNGLKGDLGTSFGTSHPVTQDLRRAFPATLELTTYAMVLAILVGIPLGVIAAVNRNGWVDHLSRFLSVSGVAVPVFWLSLMMIYFFFYKWQIAPPPLGRLDPRMTAPSSVTGWYTIDSLLAGNGEIFMASLKTLIMPVVALAFGAMAPIARMARSGMVEALGSQYVLAAQALGLPRLSIIFKYAMKNALLPVVTMIAVVYGYLLGGSVLVENIFAWPGLGRYAYDAIASSDYPAVQGFVLYSTTMYVLLFLATDLIYRLLDPRIEL